MFAIFLSLSPRPSASDDKTGLLDGSNGQVKIYKKSNVFAVWSVYATDKTSFRFLQVTVKGALIRFARSVRCQIQVRSDGTSHRNNFYKKTKKFIPFIVS